MQYTRDARVANSSVSDRGGPCIIRLHTPTLNWCASRRPVTDWDVFLRCFSHRDILAKSIMHLYVKVPVRLRSMRLSGRVAMIEQRLGGKGWVGNSRGPRSASLARIVCNVVKESIQLWSQLPAKFPGAGCTHDFVARAWNPSKPNAS
jgi:hypothetical protein